MGRPLVIVESPAKARTIGKFLGSGYQVEASVGHVRDLPRNAGEVPASKKKESWARLGVDVDHGFEPLYVVPADKKAQVKRLKDALADASELYLATDEDREGESISWHLLEVLKPKVPVHRLVFHEITPKAIAHAMATPRSVDLDLVRAQETRRIVDRLFGYEVSPLLWKKVRPQLSAGRVQSVAVRLVVERERQRRAFVPAAWWDVTARFSAEAGELEAQLQSWEGRRLATGRDFDENGRLKADSDVVVLDEAQAASVVARVSKGPGVVQAVKEKPYTDRPAAPFTTSTMQQEANRKLRWTARRTMSTAQRLYENGWITYMRTDSTTLSEQAIQAARSLISAEYGSAYLPKAPRTYASKAKNAQEAHEAIRPAGDTFRGPAEAQAAMPADEARLYDLIWKRTVASQMADATGRSLSVDVQADAGLFVARGKTVDFPGYRRAYVEGSDDPDAALAERETLLPPVVEGDAVSAEELVPKGHQTQPPARLTEASLVKELEARGIGRPSTYASIIDTILRRDYCFKKGNALVPTFTAFAVTGLLEDYLSWLVDYDFTANMEEQLDEIALGRDESEACLERFYRGDEGLKQRLTDAQDLIDPRTVCTIPVGVGADGEDVVVRVGRYGPFLSSGESRASLPEDMPPDELTLEMAVSLLEEQAKGPRVVGVDPATGEKVLLMKGRFGPYFQLGEPPADSKVKPTRASPLKDMDPETVTLEVALKLLSLPRELGTDPESGEVVTATNGRYGPYVKRGKSSRSIPTEEDLFSIKLPRALELLAQPARRSGPKIIKEVGADPKTERTINLMEGRFGPYVTDGETNASLPRGASVEALTLEGAIELIRAREGAPKRGRRKPAPKAAAKKPAAKKAAAKKPAAKKPAAKKPAAKKPAAKKPAAGAAAAEVPAAKKPAAKKPAAKKPAAKKPAAKKPAARKATAAKAASAGGAAAAVKQADTTGD